MKIPTRFASITLVFAIVAACSGVAPGSLSAPSAVTTPSPSSISAPSVPATASAAAAARPICPGLNPSWLRESTHPNNGVPDAEGRIVFGPVHRFDEILGQLISPLVLMDADGSDLVKIFDCEVERPRFSPDGKRIAFSLAMDDDSWQVATIAADGSDLQILTASTGYAHTPDWSPDGSWLIYATSPVKCSRSPLCDSLNETLWRMNADGTDQHLVGAAPSSAWDWEPRLSPDGREVVFARNTPEGNYRWILMIRNLDTGEERVAKVDERDLEHPDWSPDGRFIVYHEHPSGPIELIPAHDAGAAPQLVGGSAIDGYKPAYSPDGSSIVYGCRGGVCRMSADGSDVVELLRVPNIEFNHFDWGPPTG